MFNYIPEFFKGETADTEEEADRWYEDKKNNRRTPDLLPRDEVARAINAEVKAGRGTPARRRLPRHRARGGRPTTSSKRLPVDVPPVQGAGRRRHHQGADGGRADLPLHDGRRPRRRRHHRGAPCPASSRPARSRAACTAPTAWAATRSPTCSCSAGAPGSHAARVRQEPRRRSSTVDAGAGRGGRARRCSSPFDAHGRREPVRDPRRPAGDACRTWSASSGPSPS